MLSKKANMPGRDYHNIQMQVMWNRLISVVEEQARTLIRTAFSTSVREAGDLSAGVFDPQGRMVAQAVTGTPGHVNTMAEAVPKFIAAIGKDQIFQGDAYITNDPWDGTGHLNDFTVVSPSFRHGSLIGFFACTAHVVDIGGRGFGPDAREVYEEGLCIPIMKMMREGTVNEDMMAIVRANVRQADMVVGDLYALAACNDTGDERLQDMMHEFALDDLEELTEFIFEHSLSATLKRIAALPRGKYYNSMTLDGYREPVNLCVELEVMSDRLVADFVGTSPASSYGINVPLSYARAYACYGLKCAIAPDIPNNTASLLPFHAKAPTACILNAQRPSPVSVRHVLGHFVPDLVLGALAQFMPEEIPAEGSGALWNIHISARPIDTASGLAHAEILMFNSGGTGARSSKDGLSATAFPSGVHSMSVEATEQAGPIVIWRKELRPNSSGAGKHRGGLGQIMELSAHDGYTFSFNAMFDRIDNPARGRVGGKPGAPGRVSLSDGTVLHGKGTQSVPIGKRLILELPGGGGYGRPDSRSAQDMENDLRNEYLDVATANESYHVSGVAIHPSKTYKTID